MSLLLAEDSGVSVSLKTFESKGYPTKFLKGTPMTTHVYKDGLLLEQRGADVVWNGRQVNIRI